MIVGFWNGWKNERKSMKTGTRVRIDDRNARAWGYETPAIGTVTGRDPQWGNKNVVTVRLDQVSPSIYETKGVHVERLYKVKSKSGITGKRKEM